MPRRWSHVAVLALACAVVLGYAPALHGPYQFDDYATVAIDPAARSIDAWWESAGSHVRPVLKASFVLTAVLGSWTGDAATAHRAGNIAIHLAAILAFYALGRRASRWLEPARDASAADLHALLAAAIFALHPLATEAVSYVSARSASLATLGSVLALLAWMKARQAHGVEAASWFCAGAVSFVVALGAREVAIVTPLAWVLLESLGPHGTRDPSFVRRRALLVLAAAAAAAAFVAWMAWHPRYGPLLELSMRIAEARMHEHALAAALGHLACTAALACAPNIDPAPHAWSALPAFALIASLVLAAVLAVRARVRHPMAVFALAWAALWLLPVYALPIRHDVVSERHAYPALWSLGWLAASVLSSLLLAPARALRVAGAALAAMVLGTLLLLTQARNGDYRSEVSLWEASAREAPRLRALNNLGVAYISAGRWEEAQRVLRAARALDPDNSVVDMNLERAQRRSAS
jgi:hypothetical protein